MKKRRIYNFISLMMNFSILLFAVTTIDFANKELYKYFTILSNILLAISALIMIVFNAKNIFDDTFDFPKFVVIIKFIGTVSVTITFLTVAFFLAPINISTLGSYFSLFKGENFILHFFNPILAIISFVCFEGNTFVTKKYSIMCLLPMLLYTIVYVTMVVIIGEEKGGWKDFYSFTFNGKIGYSFISFLVMYFVAIIIALGEWYMQRVMMKQNKLINK